MRDESAQKAADRLMELDLVEVCATPCAESVLNAAILLEALESIGKPFKAGFVDPFSDHGEGDVFLDSGDHLKAYRVGKELGTELPDMALAASVCTLSGPEPDLVEEGEARGGLSVDEGIGLSGELGDALEKSVNPLIEETVNNSLETGGVLNDLGIGLDTRAEDLDRYEEMRIASYLALKLVSQGGSMASERLLLMGNVTGGAGEVLRLAESVEAAIHFETPTEALVRLMNRDLAGETEVNGFRADVVNLVSSLLPLDEEGISVRRVEKGPVLAALKVLGRDLGPGNSVLVRCGDTVYGTGLDRSKRGGVDWSGEGWFAARGAGAERLQEAVHA